MGGDIAVNWASEWASLDLQNWKIAAIVGAFFLGGILKGVFGFGLPMVGVALTSLFLPVELVLALNAIPPFISNILQTRQGNLKQSWRPLLPVLIMLPPFTFFGAWLAVSVNEAFMFGILGIVIIIFVILNRLKPEFHLNEKQVPKAGIVAGIFGGILGGISTINGPPIVMYLVARKVERAVFVASLGLFFMISSTCIIASYGGVGLLTPLTATMSLACTMPVIIGMKIGNNLGNSLEPKRFYDGVLILLSILALNMIRKAFMVF